MPQSVLNFLARPEVWASSACLVGYLCLSWFLRAAPIGQSMRAEPPEAPSSGYRERVVASSVVGFLLIIAGGVLATIQGIPWSLPVFGVGFGLLFWVVNANRGFRHESPTIRRVYNFSNTALTASLIAGIVTIGNVVAFKYGGRAIDLTRDRSYSLSSSTLGQLQSLDRPISFTVFFGNSERSQRQLERVHQLLDLYKAANPSRVKAEYLDANLDLKEFETLVKRVPQIATSQGGGIVVTYGDGEAAPLAFVSLYELFAMRANPAENRPDRFVTSFSGEDAVTSALIRLREGTRSTIAFTIGHDEPSPGELDPRSGLGLWRARLSSVGIDVVEVNLLREDVPRTVNLLVICGPKRPFHADEIERVRSFVMHDGQLLVLVGNTEPSGLEEFLRTFNVEIGKGLAVDPQYNYQRRPFAVLAPIAPGSSHPIVESLVGNLALFPNSAPLIALGGPPKQGSAPSLKPSNPGVVASPFLRTASGSWVESTPNSRPVERDPANDLAGPINVGVAVVIPPARSSDPPRQRMVVFSSPTLGDNPVVGIQPANLDLLMNSIQWLRGRPSSQGIAAKTHESLLFAVDAGLRTRLVMIPTLLALLVIVGFGITTYIARRD